MPSGNGQPRTYSIAADTFAGNFLSSDLEDEILAEAGITTALLRIDRTGDVLDIWFVADLSGGEITLLDAVVNNHLGGVPPDPMAFVAATEATSAVNSITINVPAGVVDGDTLLLQVTQSDGEDGNINALAGWIEELANQGSGGAPPSEPETSIFTRIASSEPASYVATCTNGGAVGMVARMIAFRVGDQVTSLDVAITTATHTDNTPNPPSNTPVTRGCFAVAMWWHDDDLGVYGSIPAGYTDPDALGSVTTAGGGNGCSIGSAIKLLTGALQAENPAAFNVTDTDEGGSATILLRPQFEEPVPPAAAAGDVEVQDEGISLTLAVKKINFVGAGVTATEPVADEVEVTIPGGAGSVFGTEYNTAESLGQSTTTSTTPQQKLRLSVTGLPAGDYLLHWALTAGNTDNEAGVDVRVQLDDATNLTIFTHGHGRDAGASDSANGGHIILTLTGDHDIDVDFDANAGGTAVIQDVTLTLFRVT